MPSRLGRYAVRRRIGSGGFATVWLAYDEQLDSPVAVKVLADNWTEDHHVRQRFLEEGRFLRKVESPHVVSVYDAGELEDGRPYLVMSYADQGTLADRLEVEGLTAGQALEVVRQVGLGLQALHDRGVLHRDVKPANVLFRTVDPATADGRAGDVRAMLGDLGLGKSLDMSSRLTMIAGTPSFVAPEQAQGEPLDARADQYSLGALTYLLLTGRAPYAHATLAAAAAPGAPPPMSTPEREFPPQVEAVVRRGARRRPGGPLAGRHGVRRRAARGPRRRPHAPVPEPWLPIDPELTQPGARPTCAAGRGRPLPDPVPPAPPRRRRRWPCWSARPAGPRRGAAAGGSSPSARRATDAALTDATGSLAVTVPRDWKRSRADRPWTPPTGASASRALGRHLRRLDRPRRPPRASSSGSCPADELPAQMPRHPECDHA